MVSKKKSPRDQPQSDGSSSPSRQRFKRSVDETWLESLFRRVLREELERLLAPYLNALPSSSAHQADPPEEESRFQLRFVGQLPATLYTGSKIETRDPDSVLRVILVDTYTDTIVNTGPLSSLKVEVVALNGEFGSDDDQENWTQAQFDENVQREREGRRPLVAGDLTVVLVDGVGVVRGIFFTDNSSWTRCRKFKLGARKVSPAGGDRIREARSGAFVVKDHRGELYQKHHPPHLNDEVWRLEKIAKDGAFHQHLDENGIKNVKDFLCLYMKDPSKLRKIMCKIPKKTWTVIVEHAVKCVVDDNKFYGYRTSPDPQNVTVIFNSVYRVVKARFNGYFLTPDQFTPAHKSIVQNITHYVYKNENVLVPMDELSLPGPAWPLAEPLNYPRSPTMEPHIEFQSWHNNNAMAITQPLTHPVGQELDHPLPAPNNPQFVFPQSHRNSFPREDFFANFEFGSGSSGCSTSGFYQMPVIQTNHLSPEDLLRFQADIDKSWNDNQAMTELLFASNNPYDPSEVGMFTEIPAGFVHVSGHGKGKARWCKIRAFFNMVSALCNEQTQTRRMLGY